MITNQRNAQAVAARLHDCCYFWMLCKEECINMLPGCSTSQVTLAPFGFETLETQAQTFLLSWL